MMSTKSFGPAAVSVATLLAAVALVAAQAGLSAQEKAVAEAAAVTPKTPSRAELKDKQIDVSLEARDIERILGKLKRASDLSKQRITDAALKAESVSGALDRGDSKAARSDAEATVTMFKEIAKQLEALLAEETPQRVAAAQNLAQQLSQAERQFMKQFPGVLNANTSGAKGKIDPRSQVRPENNQNQNQPQEGRGTKGQKQGKSGEQKKQDNGDPNKGDSKKQANEGKGDKQKDMPPDGSGKNGDMPPDSDKEKGGGKGKQKDEPQEGDGAADQKTDGQKKDMSRQGKGSGDKQDEKDKESSEGSGGMTEEEQREALARRAEELAESGKTLEDILKTITQSTDPADAEAARMVEAVLKETNLSQAIANMQEAASTIRSGKFDDARLASLDVADRMEIASQRLGSAYRLIVAPKAEELRDIEKALADLREQLEKLQTEAQVAAWHRQARELLDKLEKLGVSDEVRQELVEEMKKAGFDATLADGAANWTVVGGHYVPPGSYSRVLVQIQEDVQQRLQSLLLGDLESSPDDATPPKYQELVERYYRVLSRESGGKKLGTPSPNPNKQK